MQGHCELQNNAYTQTRLLSHLFFSSWQFVWHFDADIDTPTHPANICRHTGHTHTHTHTAYLAYTLLLMRVYAVVLAQVMDGRTIAARLFLLLSLIFSFSPSHSLSLPLSLPVRKLCVKSSNILFYNQLLLLLRK